MAGTPTEKRMTNEQKRTAIEESGSLSKPAVVVQDTDGRQSNLSDGPKTAPKKLPRGERGQVPLMPGYGLQGWIMKKVDVLKGKKMRPITKQEVREHRTMDDCWIIFEGNVYDVTPYMHFHPGGADKLMQAAGRDATALFRKYHAWVNGKALIEKCMLGPLAIEHEPPLLEE